MRDQEVVYSLTKDLYTARKELEDKTYWSSYWLDEYSACRDERDELQARVEELQSELDEKLSIIDQLEKGK